MKNDMAELSSGKKIVFLHLSDLHLKEYGNLSELHINKIIDSIAIYKCDIVKVIIIVSGDIAYSGEESQYNIATELFDKLINDIKEKYRISCEMLIVPGNHDVLHDENSLELKNIKDFDVVFQTENFKLQNAYNFMETRNRFTYGDYVYKKIIDINDFKIECILINNAIFSRKNECYKGLLYIPQNILESISDTNNNFVIAIMHHSPEFYRDDIKKEVEKFLYKKKKIKILFLGHEHNNSYRIIDFDDSSQISIQFGGCLCENGEWKNSSFLLGILDTETRKYTFAEFCWNSNSMQYEHKEHKEIEMLPTLNSLIPINKDISQSIQSSYDKYYVFPNIDIFIQKKIMERHIENIKNLTAEILKYPQSVIIGGEGSGKTTLLNKIFRELSQKYIVIFCNTDTIERQNKKNKQDVNKVIKNSFKYTYGEDESKWQKYEQSKKEECIFIIDDIEQIEHNSKSILLEKLREKFAHIIFASKNMVDLDIKEQILNNLDKEKTTAEFRILPFLTEKRSQLIENVVKNKIEDKNEIFQMVGVMNKAMKSLLSIIPLSQPEFIIKYVEYSISNIGIISNSTQNIFGKVFEANITKSIEIQVSKLKNKNITIEKIFILLDKIAYHIHFNKLYPIDSDSIMEIIKDYKSEYDSSFDTYNAIKIMTDSKILILDEDDKYRFNNKNYLAFFVAREIRRKYQEDGKKDDLQNILKYACFGINSNILLFLIYITDNANFLSAVIDFIDKECIVNWEEFDFSEHLPKFLNNINMQIEKPNDKLKEKERRAEELLEKKVVQEEIQVRNIYAWKEDDIITFFNQISRSIALLNMVSKCLPCFEHILKKDNKDHLIEYIYSLPNKIFLKWAEYIEDDYEKIISELFQMKYYYDDMSEGEKSKKQSEISSTINNIAINFLLNLYNLAAYNSASENTQDILKKFDNKKKTYKLQNLMILEYSGQCNKFTELALDLRKEGNNSLFKNLLGLIVRHFVIHTNFKDYKQKQQLLDSFFKQSSEKDLLRIENFKQTNQIK